MIRATRARNGVVACALGALALSACDPEPAATDGEPDAAVPGAATTFVYVCPDGFRFTADTRGDSAIVELPESQLRLPQAEAASGARYEGGSDLFWSHGTEAMLASGGEEHQGCQGTAASDRPDEARLWGADFYGIGQEPGWIVEVNSEEWIRYLGDYGVTRLFWTSPAEVVAGDTLEYVAQSNGGPMIRVVVFGAPCQDAMSGQPYPYSVNLRIDGRLLTGCGMAVSDDWN